MLEDYLRQFLEHLRYERNVSAHTLRNYSSDLEQFHEHIARQFFLVNSHLKS
jgi:site-specific recombinase XerD